jgi:hypothetical protein
MPGDFWVGKPKSELTPAGETSNPHRFQSRLIRRFFLNRQGDSGGKLEVGRRHNSHLAVERNSAHRWLHRDARKRLSGRKHGGRRNCHQKDLGNSVRIFSLTVGEKGFLVS